ncbi:hypothetical protein [Actinomadura decatromicini]|uniref:Uncharacterized protein n=1 Tax=Actinomadura decatromicini TaxID=2604572 RepID=A0A5D3F5T8_9ACTN|nr:hypothetical protein [Actinomadura decatromicini]TYK43278.1 hypothetical protein FXF68_39375 [Actinomadura decatromicini]
MISLLSSSRTRKVARTASTLATAMAAFAITSTIPASASPAPGGTALRPNHVVGVDARDAELTGKIHVKYSNGTTRTEPSSMLSYFRQALAATRSGRVLQGHKFQQTMHTAYVTSLDTKDAARTGKIRVTYSNGAKDTAPTKMLSYYRKALALSKAKRTGPHTFSEEGMSCGTAWIVVGEYYNHNTEPVVMNTGWESNSTVLSMSWHAYIYGPDYTYLYDASPSLLFSKSWAGSHHSHKAYPHGKWGATLFHGSAAGGSHLDMWYGASCWPGSDLTDIEYL